MGESDLLFQAGILELVQQNHGPQYKNGHVSQQVQHHVALCCRGREATAGNIQSAHEIPGKGDHERQHEQVENDGGTLSEKTEDKSGTADQFQPGEKYGGDIDEQIGKNLIIVDDFGKQAGVQDLADTGSDENAPENNAA